MLDKVVDQKPCPTLYVSIRRHKSHQVEVYHLRMMSRHMHSEMLVTFSVTKYTKHTHTGNTTWQHMFKSKRTVLRSAKSPTLSGKKGYKPVPFIVTGVVPSCIHTFLPLVYTFYFERCLEKLIRVHFHTLNQYIFLKLHCIHIPRWNTQIKSTERTTKVQFSTLFFFLSVLFAWNSGYVSVSCAEFNPTSSCTLIDVLKRHSSCGETSTCPVYIFQWMPMTFYCSREEPSEAEQCSTVSHRVRFSALFCFCFYTQILMWIASINAEEWELWKCFKNQTQTWHV